VDFLAAGRLIIDDSQLTFPLPTGRYEVTFALSGFQTSTASNINLHVNPSTSYETVAPNQLLPMFKDKRSRFALILPPIIYSSAMHTGSQWRRIMPPMGAAPSTRHSRSLSPGVSMAYLAS